MKFWLEECRKNSDKNVSICLIGNKSDLSGKRKVTKAEAEMFAKENNLKFMETSAKSAENVVKAFLTLSSEIYRKIQSKKIDIYDKESGARYSE